MKVEDLVDCDQCDHGKMEFLTSYPFTDKPDEATSITCIWCNGKGKIPKATAEMIEYEKSMWCNCDNPSEETLFFEDGQHPEIWRHHWRCKRCYGVTQIG